MTYKYNGGGFQFIPGVPDRDLTDDEFNALTDGQKDDCLASGLYVPEHPKKKVEAPNG